MDTKSQKVSSFLCFHPSQDDSALNRKVIVKIIESEKTGRLKNARILEADDGTTAVEMLRQELCEGRKVDFVLMDYVMVSHPPTAFGVSKCMCMYLTVTDYQIRMHGPEAAIIMRQDIQYTGTIIGRSYPHLSPSLSSSSDSSRCL